MLQIVILNVIVFAVVVAGMAAIGENIPWEEMFLLHLAYLLLQIELAGICFGVSAFLRRGSVGVGLGVAVTMYFLNLISNITESAEFLKYITPFSYANGTEIVTEVTLDGKLIVFGMVYAIVGIVAAYIQYTKKDLM